MITRVEARSYRCLRYVSQPMGSFHVLVGPNASGKTTFLDVVSFLGDLVEEGPEAAVSRRTRSFHDLLWRREGEGFELAIEVAIPKSLRSNGYDALRYEVALGYESDGNTMGLSSETLSLSGSEVQAAPLREAFPTAFKDIPKTILLGTRARHLRTVINKVPGGNDNFYSETYGEKGKGWVPTFKLGPKRSALANLPEDESKFPAATWLKILLSEGIQELVLNSLLIRRASPPGQGRTLKPDGSNLPWVVADLEDRYPERLRRWVAHLQTALEDLEGVRTIVREDDRHRYLVLRYRGGMEIPSWMASDGTLRLLALTLPAYLPELEGIYLVEEPENGIHPRAVETMFQSLSSVYDAQILLATHSPVVLSIVESEDLLCFAKTEEGATDIVRGSEHPALKDWQGEINLSTLFAAGVLG